MFDPPRYRKLAGRLLSKTELQAARQEYQNRAAETEAIYDRYAARGNVARCRDMATSMLLLRREEALFFAEQDKLALRQSARKAS